MAQIGSLGEAVKNREIFPILVFAQTFPLTPLFDYQEN